MQFRLGTKLLTGLRNKAFLWRHEELGVSVAEGVDEISLALIADLYSRTRRSWVHAVGPSSRPITTRRGLTLHPDRTADRAPAAMLPLAVDLPATQALDQALEGIVARYGEPTAAFVAVQIEYPWKR
jgi:hypothetical protein